MTRGRCRAALLAVLAAGCIAAPSMVRTDPEHVVYEGPPYGDFVLLADVVRRCMGSDKRGLPRIVLIDEQFECYTAAGWKKVLGCTGEDTIYLVAPTVISSHGALWSHELTHYFGAKNEDDPCGGLTLNGFSIAQADAGR